MALFDCPLPTAITDITASACPEKWGQISKMAFQRAGAPFANLTAFKTKATWTALLAETDDTKVTVTPAFTSFVIPASEGQFFGGNTNETLLGIREYLGEGFVTVTGQFVGLTSAQAEQLRTYSNESLASGALSNLTIFPIQANNGGTVGNMIHNSFTAPTGIRIYNFRVASLDSQGQNSRNIHNFSFDLPGDWDATVFNTELLFNPFAEL